VSNKLADNVVRMTNEELIGLAKNPFLDTETRMAIAKNHYTRAKVYLAKNRGLDKETRDYLWSDECAKGYILKVEMICAGHYMDDPEMYWELYNNYPSMWTRSKWRAVRCFTGLWSWQDGNRYTPGDLLTEIFNTKLDPKQLAEEGDMMNRYVLRSTLDSLVRHPNCELNLAIRLSTCEFEQTRALAFKKIVELSK